MPSISCSVVSCSYNKDHSCNAHVIQVGGKGACECSQTCCGTYLDCANYSDLAQYTDNRETVEAILCRVDTCAYYGNDRCMLDSIQIGATERVNVYTETECQSFEKK
ncbi:MAG: DUF1540 domain-containing protein [Cellulosilyticum sp.]|nr:DUF1540 domain-containing protein [Cellulosilyticum sp.]